MAESREDLQYLIDEFGGKLDGVNLKINVAKSEVLVVGKDQI